MEEDMIEIELDQESGNDADTDSANSVDLSQNCESSSDEDNEPLMNIAARELCKGINWDEDLDPDDIDDADIADIPDFNFVEPRWGTKLRGIDIPVFTGTEAAKVPDYFNEESTQPHEYFGLFFNTDIFDMIVRSTNMYAKYCIALKRCKNESYVDHEWEGKELSVVELRAYIGICIVMGLQPSKNIEQIWSNHALLCNEGIKNIMTIRRFKKISEYLHISDREKELPRESAHYDKLCKVRPAMDIFLVNFQKFYKNAEHQTIDEAIIKYKGRVTYIQYIPIKPIKRGIKLFCRNCSKTGYLYDAQVYLGRQGNKQAKGVYDRVILDLTKSLEGNSHTLYVDNLYSNVPLYLKLLERRVYCCGTVRRMRQFLPAECRLDYTGKNIWPRGKSKIWQDKGQRNLTCTMWSDTKHIRFLSTSTDPTIVTHGTRRIKGIHTQVDMPLAAQMYGAYMGGTDKHDRLRLCYAVGRTSLKAWKYIFWFFVNASVVNSWIVYQNFSARQVKKKKYTHFDFRHDLAVGLIGGYSSRKRSSTTTNYSIESLESTLAMAHENGKITAKGTKRCKGHKKFKPDGNACKQTVYGCIQCNVPLCKECHYPWHSK